MKKKKLSEFAGMIKDEKFKKAALEIRHSMVIVEDKKIKELIGYSDENRKEILKIQKRLNDLKRDLAKLNNYRDRWTDFDVAVVCWLLAHDPDELKFWKEIEL